MYVTFSILGFSVLIVGGENRGYQFSRYYTLKKPEVVAQNGSTCITNLPDLPSGIGGQPSLIMTHNQKIILCGGINNRKSCLEMKSSSWKLHSSLSKERRLASAVVMKEGIFIFGGEDSKYTWEWLPNNGSSHWILGDSDIPSPGFNSGCAVKISEIEIALIGGEAYDSIHSSWKGLKKLLIFNTDTKNWTAEHDNVLKEGRYEHACALFSNKIIVTGGLSFYFRENLASTEVIDIQDLTISTVSGSLNQRRARHGLVKAQIGAKQTLMVMGGYEWIDSIETWNEATGNWTISRIKLSISRFGFGYLSVPTHILCP